MTMKLKFVLLVLCFVMTFFNLIAQKNNNILNAFQQYQLLDRSSDYSNLLFLGRNHNGMDIPEAAFLNDWEDAVIISKKGEIYGTTVRFSPTLNHFYFKVNDKIKIVNKALVRGIVFEDKAFVVSKIEKDDGADFHYFELLAEGKLFLLKRYEQAHKIQKNGTFKMNSKLSFSLYLCAEDDEVATPILGKRKIVLKAMEKKRAAVEKYLSKIDVNFNSEKDLIQLFELFNQKN